ncbi:histone-lysine N-methyltransferase SETMAR-like [Octopus sinensis]|uniref:Histone-lysine N-methyltransferase SETMAR-like n=1 Tax=Octopus sinensis TaxID=2607531 RepID=A0A6P7TRJ4_9MOLL|nr:histone-lysine N-methyltransferase SETMAR-like [Octopus sinensis]
MTKKDLRLLSLHEFKLGYNAFQTAANIDRVWGEESTSDRTVRRWFLRFLSGNVSFEDEEGRGWSCSLDNEQLKAIVEHNPRQSVREMSSAFGVGIATVSRNLQKIDLSFILPSNITELIQAKLRSKLTNVNEYNFDAPNFRRRFISGDKNV